MKKIIYCLLLALLSACSISRNSTSSDYSLKGNFASYRTFSIVSDKELGDEDRQIMEATLFRRLNAMGYHLQEQNPSLYISYKIYRETFKMKTYDQLPFLAWLSGAESNDSNYNSTYEKVSGETILINFYDPVAKDCIWRGYFSNQRPHQSYRELVFTVNKILDDYIIEQSRFGHKSVARK